MDNPETLTTLSTQDTEQKKTLEKTEGAIKNGQSRDTGNIEYTRHRTKKTLEKTEGAIKNGQSRDTDNIEYTSHEKKRNKTNKN